MYNVCTLTTKISEKLKYNSSNLDTTTSINFIFCTTLKQEYNKEVKGCMVLKFQARIHSSQIHIKHIIHYFIVQMLLENIGFIGIRLSPFLLQG